MVTEISPQEAERKMFGAVASGDVGRTQATLAEFGRERLAFTGRCFAHAITAGDVAMAVFCGRAGFHLNVLDEPALRTQLDNPETAAHALREYLQTYRYCRAQRTYYLPVVQSPRSAEPLRALLQLSDDFPQQAAARTTSASRQRATLRRSTLDEEKACDLQQTPSGYAPGAAEEAPERQRNPQLSPSGNTLEQPVRVDDEMGGEYGLSAHDCSELLSLAVRFDKVELARLLTEAGVELAADPQATIPAELKGNGSQTLSENPWIEVLSPHHSDEMLGFILEQVANAGKRCPIRATWFKLHFREEGFARKLATIVPASSGALCEDIPATLLALATGGYAHALSCALEWPEAVAADLDPVLLAAQAGNHLECASLILTAMQSQTPTLGALDW